MKKEKTRRPILVLVTAIAWLALAGMYTPVRSQDLVCCDMWIKSDGSWFGARRDCKAALEELSAASRAKACAQIRSSTPPIFRPFRSYSYVLLLFLTHLHHWISENSSA